MKECLDEVDLQSYLDGELRGPAAEQAASHLAGCEACAGEAREMQNEMALLATALEPEFAVSVPTEALRSRIDDAIADLRSSQQSGATVRTAPARLGFGFKNLFGLFTQPAFSYAAVAAVVLIAITFGLVYLVRRDSVTESRVAATFPSIRTENLASTRLNSPATNPEQLTVKSPVTRLPNTIGQRRTAAATTAKLLPGEQKYINTIAKLDASLKQNPEPMRAGLQVEYAHNLAVVDQAIATTRAAAQKNPKDADAAQFLISAYQSKVELMTQVADARGVNPQQR